jgi:hypothetical protein
LAAYGSNSVASSAKSLEIISISNNDPL